MNAAAKERFELEPAPDHRTLSRATCRPGASPAASSPSTPRRWGSTPIATGSAWCSSPKATAAPCWCSSPASYDAPELKRLLADESVLKIFHFGRFDMAVLKHYFGVMPRPVYCTKVASKLARTFTDRHGLKDLCRELLGIELSKQQQSSDWGARRADPGAAQLCRERRVASARAKGETRRHAEARGTRGACPRLLRVSADPGRARSQGLVRDRSFRPLDGRKGRSRAASWRSQCHQSPAASCVPVRRKRRCSEDRGGEDGG